MGWRTDFKQGLVDEFKAISGIGSVERSWKQEPIEMPALIVGLVDEDYDETMGYSTGPVDLNFTVTGLVDNVDDPDLALDDLHNAMMEKVHGYEVSGMAIYLEGTTWHEKIEGAQKGFTFRGRAALEKDYSDM